MSSIKAVLFDYGGVMNSLDKHGGVSDRLAQALRLEPEVAYAYLRNVWKPYSTGTIPEQAVWEHVERVARRDISPKMRRIWNTWGDVKPLKEMVEFVNSLKKQGYVTGVVSNSFPPTVKSIRSHGGYDMFDIQIISCEVGIAKPERAIYAMALERMPGMDPKQVLFVDDQHRCIEGAKRCGFQTIYAENPTQVRRDVLTALSA